MFAASLRSSLAIYALYCRIAVRVRPRQLRSKQTVSGQLAYRSARTGALVLLSIVQCSLWRPICDTADLTIGSSNRGSRLRWAMEGVDDWDKVPPFEVLVKPASLSLIVMRRENLSMLTEPLPAREVLAIALAISQHAHSSAIRFPSISPNWSRSIRIGITSRRSIGCFRI